MTHEELRELIPAYALDALEVEEARLVDAHLPACGECRRELSVLRDVAASLATGIPQIQAPAELRDRILTSIRPRRAGAGQRAWALGLAAAAVLVLLGGITLSLEQRLAALNTRVAAQTQLLALLTSPGVRTVTLSGSVPATVRLVFDPASHRGVLVAAGLDDPGRDLVYQLWLVAGPGPVSAGVFRPAVGQPAAVTVGADFSRYSAVAISVEHGPYGASSPTATPILVGKMPGTI